MDLAAPAAPVRHRRSIPLIVACALFMESLDSTVIATALPTIAADLGQNPLHLSLAISSYLFSLAVFIPISGWLADRLGARTVLMGGIAVFTLGSIACGLAGSLAGFVVARVLQGLGGAMMTPVGRLVLLRSIAKTELVGAMAWMTVPALVGPLVGPPLGGLITTYADWRWIFWLNVPIGVAGILLVLRFIPNLQGRATAAFDLPGFLLLAAGLLAAVAAFEAIGRHVLPPSGILGLAAVALVLLGGYVAWARRTPAPVLDLSLLRIATFRAAVLGGFLFRIGIGSIPILLPLMLQLGFGFTAFHSGLLTFAATAGALTMKLTAAPIIRRFGFRPVLVWNALLSGLCLAAIGLFGPTTPWWLVMGVLLVGGFFRSLQFTAVNTMGYADVADDRMSRATSFASVGQQLSLSVGAATGALLLQTTLLLRGETVPAADSFLLPFVAVAVIGTASALVFAGLPKDAGAEVSGKRLAPRPRA
ncbi:MAG: MFS transporter [Geminicoccaceae bacterium]